MHDLHSKWGQKLLNDACKGSNTYVCFTHITSMPTFYWFLQKVEVVSKLHMLWIILAETIVGLDSMKHTRRLRGNPLLLQVCILFTSYACFHG